jgi:hypothetical protein
MKEVSQPQRKREGRVFAEKSIAKRKAYEDLTIDYSLLRKKKSSSHRKSFSFL